MKAKITITLSPEQAQELLGTVERRQEEIADCWPSYDYEGKKALLDLLADIQRQLRDAL